MVSRREGSDRWCSTLTDGVEETVDGKIPSLARLGIAEGDGGEEIAVSLGLNGLRVPKDGDLGVSKKTLGHDLGGAENVATNNDVNVGGVLQSEQGQSRIVQKWSLKRTLVKYMPSSQAESPPPITARGFFLKMGTAPSQTAQAEIPDCQ